MLLSMKTFCFTSFLESCFFILKSWIIQWTFPVTFSKSELTWFVQFSVYPYCKIMRLVKAPFWLNSLSFESVWWCKMVCLEQRRIKQHFLTGSENFHCCFPKKSQNRNGTFKLKCSTKSQKYFTPSKKSLGHDQIYAVSILLFQRIWNMLEKRRQKDFQVPKEFTRPQG